MDSDAIEEWLRQQPAACVVGVNATISGSPSLSAIRDDMKANCCQACSGTWESCVPKAEQLVTGIVETDFETTQLLGAYTHFKGIESNCIRALEVSSISNLGGMVGCVCQNGRGLDRAMAAAGPGPSSPER